MNRAQFGGAGPSQRFWVQFRPMAGMNRAQFEGWGGLA